MTTEFEIPEVPEEEEIGEGDGEDDDFLDDEEEED
jgi:hypothetical protein